MTVARATIESSVRSSIQEAIDDVLARIPDGWEVVGDVDCRVFSTRGSSTWWVALVDITRTLWNDP